MATEHPKPWLDAICFKCDEYMMPGLPLRLLQFNHWRANSSPSLSFLSISEQAWLVGQGAPGLCLPTTEIASIGHHTQLFSIAGEGSRSQTPRPHAYMVRSWPTKPYHQPELCLRQRHWFACPCHSLRLKGGWKHPWGKEGWKHPWGVRKRSVNSVGQEDFLDKMLLSDLEILWFRCIIPYSLLLKTGWGRFFKILNSNFYYQAAVSKQS